MGAIDLSIFAQHTDAKLRVWFSDGVNGFQQLSPDRPFASVPYAFSAATATIAPGSIDRSMLSEDIRSDLNRTISHNDLSPQIKADINATIGLDRLSAEVILKLEQNATITNGSVTGSKMADGAVTANKISSNTITTNKLNEQILKYLKPEITSQPQAQNVYADTNATFSVIAEGKYLTYQWKKDGADLTGETNATLTITDANATLHDGNYSVVVSNDFGGEESDLTEVLVKDAILNGLVGWWKFDEGSGTVAYDSSGNGNDGNLINGPTWTTGKIGGALSFDGVNDSLEVSEDFFYGNSFSFSFWVHNSLNNGNTNSTSNKLLFSNGTTTDPNKHLHFGFRQSGTLFFGFHDNDLESSSIGSSTWKLFSFTYDYSNKRRRIYVDSHLVSSDMSSNHYLGRSNLVLGKRSFTSNYFTLETDDVRIYDRALSAEEVQALYNMGQ
jgi:hypothetical protein